MKNILIINHYAGSPQMGMEFRPYYFAREWIKMGHRVDIIAADFSHLRIENPSVEKDFQEELIDGIHYHWVHTLKYNGNGAKRALTMFQFVGKLMINADKIARGLKPDVVITSSTYPLDTYAGQRIKKCTKSYGIDTILIHEIHDMWPITLIEIGGMSKRHPFVQLMQVAEDSFCKNSDKVVSLLPCASEYLQEHGMLQNKFISIPNAIVPEEWDDIVSLEIEKIQFINIIKEKYGKIICFFGSHTKSYALDYIAEAVSTFRNKEVAVLFVGDGVYKNELIEKYGMVDNIFFMGKISKKCIPDLLSRIDFIYIGAVNNDMFRFGICMNKLFDSMMAGKPIIYAVCAPNNYIKEYDCGIPVVPEDTNSLINAINQLISLSEESIIQMGRNGRRGSKDFFIDILATKMASFFTINSD